MNFIIDKIQTEFTENILNNIGVESFHILGKTWLCTVEYFAYKSKHKKLHYIVVEMLSICYKGKILKLMRKNLIQRQTHKNKCTFFNRDSKRQEIME